MRVAHCDAHPDRPAVTTVVLEQHRVGYRPPLLFGYSASWRIRDLCAECCDAVIALGLLPDPDVREEVMAEGG